MILQRRLRARHARHDATRADALYGYGYRADWPSILSVAHDTTSAWQVFVITDRPCALAVPLYPATLPLIAGGTIRCVDAAQILPIKFRLLMNAPLTQGAAWTWGANGVGLVDPLAGDPLNASAGDCADTPGPTTPAPPRANVVAADAQGSTCTLTFDRPMVLTGAPADDSITFDDQIATAVVNVSPTTLEFTLPSGVSPGSQWVIGAQPPWIATPVTAPASGNF